MSPFLVFLTVLLTATLALPGDHWLDVYDGLALAAVTFALGTQWGRQQ